jgi:hypothetical protein
MVFHDGRDGADIDAETGCDDRLTVARTLYKLMVAQHPGRLVMLCDQGRVLARSDCPETMPRSGDVASRLFLTASP